jgi:hypothetical protein
MKLTKAEIELVEKYREEQASSEPVAEGFLKEDLYSYDIQDRALDLTFTSKNPEKFWLANKEQVNKWISEFTEHFQIPLLKGTRFVCYKERGIESWYDDIGYGLEDMKYDWARKYLENISIL